MGKRTFETDTAVLALLYRNTCNGSTAMRHSEVMEFDRIINENLDKMKSNISIKFSKEPSNELYEVTKDENNILYVCLKPNIGMGELLNWSMENLQTDIIIASQMPNALEVIGLEIFDGKFIDKMEKRCSIKK